MNIHKTALLTVLLLAALAPALRAGGAQEEGLQDGEVRLYLMLGEGDSMTIGERMHLPTSLALYVWNTFERKNGQISVEAEGGYRVRTKKTARMEKWNGWTLYGYHLALSWYSTAPSASGKVQEVAFEYGRYPSGDPSSVLQPAARAVQEAIRHSGRQSGAVRLLELTYLEQGRFRARVEIR